MWIVSYYGTIVRMIEATSSLGDNLKEICSHMLALNPIIMKENVK